MATISDGTSSVTPDCPADETLKPIIDKSVRKTSSGSLRSQVAGERLQIEVKMRLTGAEYRALLDMHTQNASGYFYYTPEQTYSIWEGKVEYPITCELSAPVKKWDNRKVYYVDFVVTSLDYIC
ncbi:hypothetical protein OAP25_03500 [Flavobacteriaceae bacterium]|nr:hypothetical protein [Flavobacteriaceae bacterium]